MGQDVAVSIAGDARTRVFLSYSRRDAALVTRVAEGLTGAGFLADFDKAAHDPGNVSAGISAEDEWWKRLQEMIASADVMVFLVSPDSAQSAVCDEEIAYARALGKRIIAVLARAVDFAKAPPRLSALNVRIDFSDSGPGFDAGLAALVAALQTNVGWHRDGRKYYARVQEWDTAGRPKSRLLREGAVEEAERWAVARPRGEPEPGELFLAWIAASRAQIKRDAAVRAFWRRITAVFVLTTLAATLAGAWFVINGQRNLGRSESLMLARTSDQFYNAGDYLRALHLAILASQDSFLAPSTDEAKAAFAKSAQALNQRAALRQARFVNGAGASPDGRRLVTTDESGEAILWDLETGRQIGPVLAHAVGEIVAGIAFSAESKRFLTRSSSVARLWDAETGAEIGAGLTHELGITDATHLPGSSRVLTLGWDGAVRLWDSATGAPAGVFSIEGVRFHSAGFSDDGRFILTVAGDGAWVWDAETGAALSAGLAMAGPILRARLSPDGTEVLTWDERGNAALWNLITGATIPLEVPHNNPVYDAVFLPAADRLVTWDTGGGVRLWDTANGDALGPERMHNDFSRGPPVAVETERLVTWTYLGGVKLWDTDTGELINEDFEGTQTIQGAKFVPGGGYFLTWNGQEAQLWNAFHGELTEAPYRHNSTISAVSFSPTGDFMLTQTEAGEAMLWDTFGAVQIGAAMPHTNYNFAPFFLADGRRFVTLDNAAATLWAGADWTDRGARGAQAGYVDGSDVSPDGETIVTRDDSLVAQMWRARTRERVGAPELVEFQSLGASFTRDSTHVAIWGRNEIRVFDTASGAAVGGPIRQDDEILAVEFGADAGRLVTSDETGGVRIWDTATGKSVGAVMQGGESGGNLAVPLTRERAFVWWGNQGHIIDTATGTEIGKGPLHDYSVGADGVDMEIVDVAFSADGTHLATSSSNEVLIWDLKSGAAIGGPIGRGGQVMQSVLSDDGRRLAVLSGESVDVYETETGARLAGPMLHEFGALGAAFSGDAALLLTWDEGKGQVWRASSGTKLGEPVRLSGTAGGAAFSPDGKRVLIWDPAGTTVIHDTVTGGRVFEHWHGDAYHAPHWSGEGSSLQTVDSRGLARMHDVSLAMRADATPDDVSAVCAAKLKGSLALAKDGREAPFVRLLDAQSVFAAPILRGREGEDVCAAPKAPWWETAAGAVFGWAFE